MLLPVCLMAAASPRMGLSSYTRNMAETLLCKRNSSKRPGKHMQRVDLLHSTCCCAWRAFAVSSTNATQEI
ncbi:hypothetical protein DUNSADRAFT_4843 [Dunaliella salina]|uniref:Secreted protein n=1 Tax=Dunaliella salina TaxID=3046 RepID=A0ABQ7GR87_DUNSA|nr:hypothetical protein DUNSADRAFT_4843 [Dunaliella salina]|eukprot:KAF5837120.1 hypothetical protein DUNSADRAFT_4843 [Dunaliella salina]